MDQNNRQPVVRAQNQARSERQISTLSQPANLADLLERVLDKGIVIAGDITLSLGTVEVLTLKIRLLIASVDKAQEIGINWWQSDPALSSQVQHLLDERDALAERVKRLEDSLSEPPGGQNQDQGQGQPPAR